MAFTELHEIRLLSRLLAVMSWAQRTRTMRNRVVNPWASFWNRRALVGTENLGQRFLPGDARTYIAAGGITLPQWFVRCFSLRSSNARQFVPRPVLCGNAVL